MKFPLALLLVLLLNPLCLTQERKVDEPISDELYEIVSRRAAALRTEIASKEPHDWAGVYMAGDHHPTVFSVAPKNGFLITSSLHTFSPSWVNFGRVTYSDARLTFYPELTNEQKSAHVMPTEYAVIRWGADRFLVPPTDLLNFAYDVHSGSDLVDYFTRETGSDKPRKGLPELPQEYSKYLRMKPITARVISAKEAGNYSAGSVVIDAGSNRGVIEGMSFFLLRGKENFITLVVDKVKENRAECRVSGIGGGPSMPDNYWVKTGMRFSSRMPKNYVGRF